MKNLYIDYIFRKKIFKNILNFPCSLYLFDAKNKEKYVITIHFVDNKYFKIKKWLISKCESTDSLPPCEEFVVDDIFKDLNLLIDNKIIVSYKHEKIFYLVDQENWNNYDQKVDSILNCSVNLKQKENWLWNNFLKIYNEDVLYLKDDYGIFTLKIETKKIVKEKFPRSWAFWENWKDNMLFLDTAVSAELILENFKFYK